jgi:hypothetical protein
VKHPTAELPFFLQAKIPFLEQGSVVIKSKKPSKSTATLLIQTLLSAHDSSWTNIQQLLKNLFISELDPFLLDELTTTDIDHATIIIIITCHAAIYLQVPQESSTSSDPAILEWVKQAWDSRTAGSLVFPANPRFKIKLVRYKEIIHQYYSKNSKVSMLKIRQVNEDQGGVASKVENHFEINLQCLQIEKHWIADLEEENLVAIEHMAYELVEEATKFTDAMGEVYIPY